LLIVGADSNDWEERFRSSRNGLIVHNQNHIKRIAVKLQEM